MKKINMNIHGFHLVDPSPWPLMAAFSALMTTFGGVLYMHGYSDGNFLWRYGLIMIMFCMFGWWKDVVSESTYEGQHTKTVQTGLTGGMILFIVSEMMFFFGFFWAFFHLSFNPSIFMGGVWPPAFLTVLNAWKIPLLNTILLLTSGATVTWAHHSIIWGSKEDSSLSLTFTICLAMMFTLFQAYEYATAPFTMNDSAYGSVFYMTTGFHGFHVFVGTCFLSINLMSLYYNHFTSEHHLGFEAAAWYWHFVDVVWLFLFLTVYWWGA